VRRRGEKTVHPKEVHRCVLCIVSRPLLHEVESCTITFIQHKFYAKFYR
jgi:hypothetical protein